MSIKKKAAILSFVGITAITLGLQSQQVFASTYNSSNCKTYSCQNNVNRYNRRSLRRYYNCYKYNWNNDIIESPDVEVIPEEKPQTRPETKPETRPDEKPDNIIDNSINSFEQRVVDLTNLEREKQGLPALKIDTELSKVAKLKSQDIYSKGYFDHNSPTYGSPFDMMRQFGINYRSAGENIAKGQRTPEEVVNGWMNSPGHRANILGNYTHIGVGYVDGANVWTQMFIAK